MGADAVLDLSADAAAARVAEALAALDDELVGLAPVKRRVGEIAALLQVDRARRRFGLTTSRPTLHMSFTGGPGTGKTTIAHVIARGHDTTFVELSAVTAGVKDVRQVIEERHPEIRRVVRDRGDDARYDIRTERLIDALQGVGHARAARPRQR